jgi:hypothetical protein
LRGAHRAPTTAVDVVEWVCREKIPTLGWAPQTTARGVAHNPFLPKFAHDLGRTSETPD